MIGARFEQATNFTGLPKRVWRRFRFSTVQAVQAQRRLALVHVDAGHAIRAQLESGLACALETALQVLAHVFATAVVEETLVDVGTAVVIVFQREPVVAITRVATVCIDSCLITVAVVVRACKG